MEGWRFRHERPPGVSSETRSAKQKGADGMEPAPQAASRSLPNLWESPVCNSLCLDSGVSPGNNRIVGGNRHSCDSPIRLDRAESRAVCHRKALHPLHDTRGRPLLRGIGSRACCNPARSTPTRGDHLSHRHVIRCYGWLRLLGIRSKPRGLIVTCGRATAVRRSVPSSRPMSRVLRLSSTANPEA